MVRQLANDGSPIRSTTLAARWHESDPTALLRELDDQRASRELTRKAEEVPEDWSCVRATGWLRGPDG